MTFATTMMWRPLVTEINMPKFDVGIKWNSFGYDWNIENPIISEKEKL